MYAGRPLQLHLPLARHASVPLHVSLYKLMNLSLILSPPFSSLLTLSCCLISLSHFQKRKRNDMDSGGKTDVFLSVQGPLQVSWQSWDPKAEI